MKWYDKSVAKMHRASMTNLPRRIKDQDKLLFELMRWVPKIVLALNREYASAGSLDLNDLISIGNYQLMVALNRLDFDKDLGDGITINTLPDVQKPAVIWTYVKKSIHLNTKKEMIITKDGIRASQRNGMPRVDRKTKQTAEENFMTQLFPDFFEHYNMPSEPDTFWQTVQLGIGLDEAMDRFLSFDESKLLKMNFGLDVYAPTPLSKLEMEFNKAAHSIRKMKSRAISKLRNDDAKKIIQNFYDF